MFSLDRWQEVFDTMRRNKLRTTLTAISVAWGIFVMVTLLGVGRGLDNALRYSFRREATNGIWISANKTSQPFGGYDVGRHLTFDNRDYDRARETAGVDKISAQFFIKGGQFGGGEMLTRRGTKSNSFQINAVHADAIYLDGSEVAAGRFLNEADVAGQRKSAVVGKPVVDYLFARGENAIGQWINVAGVPFEIVGVFTNPAGEENEREVYIPISTAQLAFHGSDHVGMLMLTVGDATAAQAKVITQNIVNDLAAHHNFSPQDKQAARVHDNVEGFERFTMLFTMISIFVVVIGCGTLAAGVVGVSNIMMIAVAERTKEIGVRKALGATPFSIVSMIIQEAVVLTAMAGLVGLACGVLALTGIDEFVESEFMRNPSINLAVGIYAALGLVAAGALAGFFPARSAARVNPIHSLRDQ